jgi:hypothetical protein
MSTDAYFTATALGAISGASLLSSNVRSLYTNIISLGIAVASWKPIELLIVVSLSATFRAHLLDTFHHLTSLSPPFQAFLFLFVFKFLKVVVHTISYISYRPSAMPSHPAFRSEDCTVIIPTVGDLDAEFVECIQSVLACNPHKIIISTVGRAKFDFATKVCAAIDEDIDVIAIATPSKRAQVVAATKQVDTHITVLADDHVFWPPTFLSSAVSPFEDPRVGLVGTVKRVRRTFSAPFSAADMLNFIACLYLERHNFECTASSFIDGGVFVISGRTALLRTSIFQSPSFQYAFLNEYWMGKGPLNVDDDNFTCRWMVSHGHKTVFHNAPEALMETTLGMAEAGGWKKFRGQLNRWARTTWRSNPTSLFVERAVWRSQPWSVYAVYLSSFVNFVLFYDTALFFSLYYSSFGDLYDKCSELSIEPYGKSLCLPFGISWSQSSALWILAGLILLSKLIKPLPHYMRNPRDLMYVPLQIAFGYWHSWVKLYALLTVRNVAWGTRKGVA